MCIRDRANHTLAVDAANPFLPMGTKVVMNGIEYTVEAVSYTHLDVYKRQMYSKDISRKVHSSYLLKAQKGQFTGCLAPFGYRKDPEDKNHLLIDEEKMCIRDRYLVSLF